ncbi:MAG: SMP-30/gluconolactonase/LRE family protein [Planctomycetota bacterium]|jgi:gluconolactonase|nr:SMP-30/gluconolactonase/LRE family protein [Planctomycetota bacterium]
MRTLGELESLSPEFDELVPSDAKPEILTEGLVWSEGPVWVKEGGYLLFSDIPPNMVYKWKEGEGRTEYLTPSGYTGETPRGGEQGSNALVIDPEGRLVLCQHGDRRMARMDAPLDAPAPEFVTLADSYEGKRFNSPNDCVYRSDGDLFFTDPPYGFEKNDKDPAKELDFQGVYRLTKDGGLILQTDGLSRPNGLAFSPDEKTFYVGNSDPEHAVWKAYDLDGEGNAANGRVFFDSTSWVPDNKGLPDGFKLDKDGNMFATGPGGVIVLDPEANHLGTIRFPVAISNCAWGEDGSTLFITAHMHLVRIRLNTVGA